MSYLLDTNIVIDNIRGRVAARQLVERLSVEGIAISGMSYGELWEGIATERAPSTILDELAEILLRSRYIGSIGKRCSAMAKSALTREHAVN